MLPAKPVLPWWVIVLVFLPLQVWLLLNLHRAWGVWPTAGAILVVSLLAARAARPRGLLAWLFPGRAERRQAGRALWLVALAVLAAVSFALPWGPQPWLPAFTAAAGAKAALA